MNCDSDRGVGLVVLFSVNLLLYHKLDIVDITLMINLLRSSLSWPTAGAYRLSISLKKTLALPSSSIGNSNLPSVLWADSLRVTPRIIILLLGPVPLDTGSLIIILLPGFL